MNVYLVCVCKAERFKCAWTRAQTHISLSRIHFVYNCIHSDACHDKYLWLEREKGEMRNKCGRENQTKERVSVCNSTLISNENIIDD